MIKRSLKCFLLLLSGFILFSCNNTTEHKTKAPAKEGSLVDTMAMQRDPLEMINDSIAADSTNADYYVIRAKINFNREQISRSVSDINKALTIDNKNVDAYLVLADIYYGLGDETNILSSLNKAVEVAPDDARPLIKLAELSLIQKNYQLTMGYIDRALAIDNINPRAYYIRGEMFLSKQDTISALKNFMTAREQDADFYEALYEIGSIYADKGNPLAVDFLNDAIKRFPNYPAPRYRLAMFLQENGNPNAALSQYDTLIMLQPSNSNFVFNKGYVHYVYFSNYSEALECFDQALLLEPTYVDALYNKGCVLEDMGNYKQAQDIFLKILVDNPDYQLAKTALERIQ